MQLAAQILVALVHDVLGRFRSQAGYVLYPASSAVHIVRLLYKLNASQLPANVANVDVLLSP